MFYLDANRDTACPGLTYSPSCNTPVTLLMYKLSRKVLRITVSNVMGHTTGTAMDVEVLSARLLATGNIRDRYLASAPSTQSATMMCVFD